ncbi:MAG: YceI family protein [Candidatus Paceibacterota bacterium]
MNKTVGTIIAIVVIIILAFLIFGNRAEAPEAPVEDDTPREVVGGSGTYDVDATASEFEWEAGKTLVVNYKDSGTIELESGEVVVEDGTVTSGTLVFDMTTISAVETSKEQGALDRLSAHLMSDDFFGVEMYPQATFEVTDVELVEETTYSVTGDLTIRDNTESITFPAEIYAEGDDLIIDATMTVDRTLFDVRFGSGKFFENLGDNVIGDEFILDARVVATPQE